MQLHEMQVQWWPGDLPGPGSPPSFASELQVGPPTPRSGRLQRPGCLAEARLGLRLSDRRRKRKGSVDHKKQNLQKTSSAVFLTIPLFRAQRRKCGKR